MSPGARGGAGGAARKRLAYAAAPVAVLLMGYAASAYYFASRERTETRSRIPERPALDTSRKTLAPVLDTAEQQLRNTPTADNMGRLGQIYHANDYFDQAAACYERAMELDPKNARWPYLLAYLYNMKGQTETTAALLDRTILLDPNYRPALLRRADNRYKSGQLESAKEDYLRCLDLRSTDEYARLGLARIATGAGQWEEAEKQLRMAVDANNTLGTAYRLLATVYEHLGKEAEKRQSLLRADTLGRFVASPDPWVDSLDQLCYHTEKLLTRGFAADHQLRPDKAMAYYRRVLELDPENFLATAQLGDVLQKLGKFKEAEPLLLKALTLPARDKSRYDNINTNLGNIYFWLDATEKAVPYYAAALDGDPDLEAAHQGLASCFLKLGVPEKAIPHCERAQALNPDSYEAQYNWGQSLLLLGEIEAALPHFAEAARLNPSLPSAEYKAGAYYFEQGYVDKATPYLQRALELARDAGNPRLASQIETFLGE